MNTTPVNNNWKRFFIRIILPAILAILLFTISIFAIIIPALEANIMERKREMIRELTNSAWSILLKYQQEVNDSILTEASAKQKAIDEIRHLRYGEEMKDYFWITDMGPNMIMHPYRRDLDNQPLNNFEDPHGKKLFVEFVNIVKNDDEGYADYMWQWKDDSSRIVPKLSYVKLFKPWNWIIGTGIYIEDVKTEIQKMERKLIIISLVIILLIALLLMFIMRQSIRIEKKRRRAELELQQSQKKYRALVEAATEGLIMLIDGKIGFTNNIVSKMTGFDSSDLLDRAFSEFIAGNNPAHIAEVFLKPGQKMKEGQFELNLIRKDGGTVKVLITVSNTVFYENEVVVFILKDISPDDSNSISGIDYQKLASTLDLGLFRAVIDNKGRFISANQTAIKILGFNSFEELAGIHILELLADASDRKSLKSLIEKNGFIKNKVLKITRKNRETAMLSLSLVAFTSDWSQTLICDGIIQDITLQEKQKAEKDKLIAGLKSESFLMEQPLKGYCDPVFKIHMDKPISEAVLLMNKKKCDCLLLEKTENEYIGIVTGTDLQKRALSLNLKADNPVYLIMSAPVLSFNDNAGIYEALDFCSLHNINHLPVKNDAGLISGVFNVAAVYKKIGHSLSFIHLSVKKSESAEEIKECYSTLKQLVGPLIKSDISVRYINAVTTTFSDEVIKKLISLVIKEIGPPPVSFSFVCLGSEGRREESLLTDQDNAIIYEDVSPDIKDKVSEYFSLLGTRVCDALNFIGYSFCIGNIMAKNPQWCQPISVWEKYFAEWITTPEPQNLLDAIIFFDFRTVYGDEIFAVKLRSAITGLIENNQGFLYHLAHNTMNIKLQQISGSMLSDKNPEYFDLKKAVMPFTMFARTYALKYGIWHQNTSDRIEALKSEKLINDDTADEVMYACNFLMKLRFKNQVFLSEHFLPLSNTLNLRKLIDTELFILKRILTTAQTLQNKIGTDFRIST